MTLKLPPVETVAVALVDCVIVNTLVLVTFVTWNNLSSKSASVYPVPAGKVTLSNKIISPAVKPWLAFVIEQIGEPFVVSIVHEVKVVFKGVIS